MENKLFLLKGSVIGGTKIVLNKQSDLKLTGAEILKPIGITETDIAGLVAHFEAVETAAKAEEAARISGDTALNSALESEIKTRQKDVAELTGALESEAKTRAEEVAIERQRIDTILDGSTIELDQFKEIVDFVEAIDLENDNSLIAAIDKVNADHKADMEAEAKARTEADSEIIASVGYNDRGEASADAFDRYAEEVSTEIEANGSSPFGPINEVNFEAWKAAQESTELKENVSALNDRISSEAKASVDRDSDIIASVGYNDRGEASADAFDRYASEVSAEIEANGSSPFGPINEVNFEAWKAAQESTELKENVKTLNDTIKREAEASIDRDSDIIASVGYNDRGEASADAFDRYASEVSAEIEANGSSPFGPINEVNFEAWKAAQEEAQLEKNVKTLNDTIKREAEASVDRDSEIIESIGFANRGEASADAFDRYASEVSAEIEANGSSPFGPINEVNFEAWKAAQESTELKENVSKLNDTIKKEVSELTGALESEAKTRAEEVAIERQRIDTILDGSTVDLDQFSEIVSFVESIDLENDASLIAAIDKVNADHKADMEAEIKARTEADSEIIATIGFSARGAASKSHFEEYLDSSAEFENSVKELAQLESQVVELEDRIAEANERLAQAEEAGNTDLIAEIKSEIEMLYSDMAQTKDSVEQIQASGVLKFEVFMPINEVNFEAWKSDRESIELSENVNKLNDTIKREAEASIERDEKITTIVGYNDRGAASTSLFEVYLDSSAEFKNSVKELAHLEEQVVELEDRIAEANDRLAQAEEAGNTDLIAEIKSEIEMLYSDMAQTKDSVEQIQASGVLEFEAFMPVNEVNFEAWKTVQETIELKEKESKLYDRIAAETKASVERDEKITTIVGYNDRGAASTSLFEVYLDSSAEFKNSVKELAHLEEQVVELEDRIAEANERLAQAEEAGNTDLIAEINAEIKMLHADKAQTQDSIEQIQASGVLNFEVFMPVNEVNFEAWKADKETTEFKEVTSRLNDELKAEIERATAAEEELTGKVADIIENTDLTKVDSFVELIDKVNEVSAANFDSIYAKKVAVTFNGVNIVTLSNPVKPESMMLYINGLMVENGGDYTEIIAPDGMVTGAKLLGDAVLLAQSGAKLASYGVHGSFTNVNFIGIDYAKLIADLEMKIRDMVDYVARLEADREETIAQYNTTIAQLEADKAAAQASGDTATVAMLTEEIASETTMRDEENAYYFDMIAKTKSDVSAASAELAQLKKDADAAGVKY